MSLSLNMDISVIEPLWSQIEADLEAEFQRALKALTEALGSPNAGELSVALVSDAGIRALNKTYRGKDKATNVLSFPAVGAAPFLADGLADIPPALLGDIVLAYETILREAEEKSVSVVAHCLHLFVHGFLHLRGFDHDTCLLYTSPSPRDLSTSRMPSSA